VKRDNLYALVLFTIVFSAAAATVLLAPANAPRKQETSFDSSKVAVVESVFTSTAYWDAFYVWYMHPDNATCQRYLNVSIKDNWLSDYSLYLFIQPLHFNIINDIDVHMGRLFYDNGTRRYDTVVIGFSEYVTQQEYDCYKHFVASGGKLVIMGSDTFQCEVKYYPPDNSSALGYISLVEGHSVLWNGTTYPTLHGQRERWHTQNLNWIGSNVWHYWSDGKDHYDYFIINGTDAISTYLRNKYGERVIGNYSGDEENLLENFTDTEVIGYWHLINPSDYPTGDLKGFPVATYVHKYCSGRVFDAGIMGVFILDGALMKDFLLQAIKS
jgi:hypothetical protein